MNIGITGANGFIGSHLFNELNSKFDCEAFDRRRYNLLDVGSMRGFVENKDYIFHLAGANRASDEDLIKVNAFGTLNLLEAIRKYSKVDTRFIFASSLQVYGFQNTSTPLDEETTLTPDNAYGLSKKIAECEINKYSEHYGLKTLIFRISNVYGKGCRPNYNSVIATFIDQIRKGSELTINGSGEQTRDYIYISDVINAVQQVFNYNFRNRNIDTFNICTGNPLTIRRIVSALEKIMSATVKVRYIKSDKKDNHLVGCPFKAINILKYTANISLDEGLLKAIDGGI